MTYYDLLLTLTSSPENADNFDDKLQKILEKVLPQLPDNTAQLNDNPGDPDTNDLRLRYLETLAFVLKNTEEDNTSDDNDLMSLGQFKAIKVAVELIVSIGIIPCLLPSISMGLTKLCPRAMQLNQEKIDDLQKYKRLSFSASTLSELYKTPTFRPAILSQLGPLLATLLQLHHAPLMKPTEVSEQQTIKPKFTMTPELYNNLKMDQEKFGSILDNFLKECPQPMIIKELMVILGIKSVPTWLHRNIRIHLVDRIMQANGVISIIAAVCDDALDVGEHWSKLDTVAKLIAVPQGRNPDIYYKAICPQILDLLSSKQIKHGATMANCCITALYEFNPNICITNIVDVMFSPFLTEPQLSDHYPRTENDIEQSIECLIRTFVTVEAKFKHLPCKLMSKIAIPLFTVYNDVRQSACGLKNKLKQLLLRILHEEELRSSVFPVFLGHEVDEKFGCFVTSRFGPTGGIEIVGIEENPKYEDFGETLMDLIGGKETLSGELFTYLLKFLSKYLKVERTRDTKNVLETEEDNLEQIQKQLLAVQLLSNLANTSIVQEAQIKKPEELFSFIKSLFSEYTMKNKEVNEDDCEILYVSLMLVKIIMGEKRPTDWKSFDDFARCIKGYSDLKSIPKQLVVLIKEVVSFIETQGRSERQNYQDLSVDRKASNKFEEALKDLADPLLPVRAHGLMTLTKLIERKDPCAVARKAIVLRLFEENLKHEDSFIYLAAINGFCALASAFPEIVLQTLVQEFIDMPQRGSGITSETRMKLGEILVKTTRALGEMATPHKNLLVNGFLCAVKDPDPLVRASSLSCLGELCKVLGFRLGNIVTEVIYCITCIVKSDKVPEPRRAAVLVATLLLRGLGKDTLTSLGKDLLDLYRGLKHLRNNDNDPVLRLHAQLALEELDVIVRDFLFATPQLQKRIFLLDALS